MYILDMRKEVAEMTVDEGRMSVNTEDEESNSISPVKTLSSIHIKENSPFIYPSSTITDVKYLTHLLFTLILILFFIVFCFQFFIDQ